ncbi:MAG TPA: hypothetical protein VEV81_05885 [Pyrinomonadaceae bacterium]|jgi:hypothetical protein|nr:hypothetical protein [Pyrinomonadaceae bacterium]
MSEAAKAPAGNADVSFEKRDVHARAILWVGIAIIVSAVIIHSAVWVLFDLFNAREAHKGKPPATLVNTKRQPPPAPRLQTDAPADLQEMRARETAALESYGWVDRQKGVVHIPVERAIDLLVERGLPKTQSTMPNAAASQTAAGRDLNSPAAAGQGESQQR